MLDHLGQLAQCLRRGTRAELWSRERIGAGRVVRPERGHAQVRPIDELDYPIDPIAFPAMADDLQRRSG